LKLTLAWACKTTLPDASSSSRCTSFNPHCTRRVGMIILSSVFG
jgi:hypothetical protein